MHCFISWSIKAPGGSDRNMINEALLSTLDGYEWVRPFGNIHVVKLQNVAFWEHIHDLLSAVADKSPHQVSFIMSPPIQGGSYNGILDKEVWSALNKITNDE